MPPSPRLAAANRAIVAGLALACWLPLACGPASPPPPGDIVLITVDTLRPDHMSLYGYERETTPRLDAWFGEDRAAVFELSYSTEAATAPSVVSFLSGLLPQHHLVRLLHQWVPARVAVLPDLLPDRYETAAVVSNAVLSAEALGIADRFDFYDDFVDELEPNRTVFERKAERTTDVALSWVEAREDAERPLFLWIHYIDPHGPYLPPEEWERSFSHDEPVPIARWRISRYMQRPGEPDGLDYVDGYDEEIRYTDHHVGRLLDGLDELLGLDDALVLFTADHGESMMEHESWFTHGYHVYEEIVRVPLMLRGPGVQPGRVSAPVSGIDVAPTLLGFAGGEVPRRLKGDDLRDHQGISPGRVVLVEASDLQRQVRAIIKDGKKLMASVSPQGEIVGWGVFDLQEDPEELDVQPIVTVPALTATLRTMIRLDPHPGGVPAKYREGTRLTAPKVAPGVEGEQLDRLRALGYAE